MSEDTARKEYKLRAYRAVEDLRGRLLYGLGHSGIPVYMHYDGADDFTADASQLERIRSTERAREVATAAEEALAAADRVIAVLNKHRS